MLDTKWTRFKYSGFTKAITSIIILLGGTVFIWCLLWFVIYGDSTKGEIADSYEYREQFMRRVHNAAELTTQLKSIEHINNITIDENERNSLYGRYNTTNINLNDAINFVYIIKDLKSDEVVKSNTEMTEDEILQQKNHVFFSENQVLIKYGDSDYSYELSNYLGYINGSESRYYGDDILSFLSKEEYELYAAVQNTLIPGDVFYDLSVRSSGAAVIVTWWQRLLMASSIVFAMGLILMAFLCGRSSGDDRIHTNGFDRIVTEAQIVAFGGVLGLMGVVIEAINYNNDLSNMVAEASTQIAMISFLVTMIGLVFYCSLIRQIKAKMLLRASLVGYFFQFIKNLFWRLEGIKLLKPSWYLFFVLYGVASLVSGVLIGSIGMLLFIFIQLIFGFVFLKQLSSLKQIMEATKLVSSGELEVVLDTEKFPKVMVDFYDNIYHVQSDMRQAIEKAVKGERMKAELITNVSHDLKTPLTSIISYVDLLSKEPLETEASKHYVEVLVTKSDMLKRLIEDLIDASKVSTGNVQMDFSTIGLNELVRQSVGEFQERFESKSLDIRVQEDEQLSILADGKSMWRVMENMFDNVTKYALPSSRVYVQLSKTADKGMIVIKNISEIALEIKPEELLQRFVRGAESRTTDGSGLGLSIAEGLIKAQNGVFKIDIDGDLFKITIEMPIIHEVNEDNEDLD